MTDLSFRTYRAADRDACLALFDGHVPQYFRPDERPGFESFLVAPPGEFSVMENSDGAIVACGGVAIEEDGRVGSLCWGIVHVEYQRQGLGSLLARIRVSALGWERCDVARLETISTTAKFFEKLGFSTVRTDVDGHAPGIDRVEMEFVLSDSAFARLNADLLAQATRMKVLDGMLE
jgi:ribosomal protein S18 acetylase RimI-like enzyme